MQYYAQFGIAYIEYPPKTYKNYKYIETSFLKKYQPFKIVNRKDANVADPLYVANEDSFTISLLKMTYSKISRISVNSTLIS